MFGKYFKSLLFIPFIVSCAVEGNNTTTTLEPMIDSTTSTYLTVEIFESDEFQFLDDFYYFYGLNNVPYDDDYLVYTANLWCELMSNGMTHDDIVERINEGAENQIVIDVHYAIIESAVINICEDNYSVWYD